MAEKCRIAGCENGISNIKRQLCQKHYRKQQAAGLDQPIAGDMSLQDQKTAQEVEKLRLHNEETRGALRRVEDVDATWIKFIATLRTGLEALPGRVKMHSVEPVSPDVMAAIREAIDDCVRDLGLKVGKTTNS